jgi:phosphoribosyl 1,2-cyclic phosphodiesterase
MGPELGKEIFGCNHQKLSAKMKFTPLGSGSGGNATWFESRGAALLVDAGFSLKKLLSLMTQARVDSEKLKGILLTHEHADHAQGVFYLARQFDIPIFTSRGTAKALEKNGSFQKLEYIKAGDLLNLFGLKISVHPLPHDAAEPLCFSLSDGRHQVAVLTDLGEISAKTGKIFADCDALVLEANYDEKLLASGPYPKYLKSRIKSNLGHLSNQQTGFALQRFLSDRCRFVLLAHLSKNNNSPEKALKIVKNCLKSSSAKNLGLGVSDRDKPYGLMDLSICNRSSGVSFGYPKKIS